MSKPKYSYVLKTVNKDMEGYHSFKYPVKGLVEAPDWNLNPTCGEGLHGWLNGEGDGSLGNWSNDAKWLVLKVETKLIVDLERKVKFPKGEVIFVGDRLEATNFLQKKVKGAAIIGATITGGYKSTVTGGDYSTIIGGDNSTIIGGDNSTVTGDDNSTVIGGNKSTVTGGDGSTVTGGYNSTVTGGNESTVTGGNYSTVTGGNYSTVTGGNWSTVTGGVRSTVTGGCGSILNIQYYDYPLGRYRIKTAYVGEEGILPGVKYKLDLDRNFKEVY